LTLSSTRTLSDGYKIPRFGLGLYDLDEKHTKQAVLWALENGYRMIDTAASYNNEKRVGEALRESAVPRSEVYLVTKVYHTDHGYEKTMKAYDRSLSALGVDYVDLYLIHFPVPAGVVGSWEAMAELQGKGLTRSIGVSNFNIHHLEALQKHSVIPPVVNQIEVHPYLQMEELVDFCRKHSIAIQAYSPLTRGEKLHDPLLRSLGDKYGKTPAQVLLRWSLQKGYICISKSVQLSRIIENVDVFNFTISMADMEILDGLEENLRTGRHKILWPWEG
ncbi:predicted protein, partial [Nematostella vectensis]